LFGFFCYLTYDATNLAVLKGYDTTIAIVDTIWGAVLGGIVSGLSVTLVNASAGRGDDQVLTLFAALRLTPVMRNMPSSWRSSV
jgi:hypothetical protein